MERQRQRQREEYFREFVRIKFYLVKRAGKLGEKLLKKRRKREGERESEYV